MDERIGRRGAVIVVSAALASPAPAAPGQRPPPRSVGFLNGGAPESFADRVEGFRAGLAQAGFVEGRNLVIDFRWAMGRYERLASLASELVERKVDAICATGGDVVALAAAAATTAIPIVFVIGGDPVGIGLVRALNLPGGNVTGVSLVSASLAAKRLEILKDVIPDLRRVLVIVNPTSPTARLDHEQAQAAGRALSIEVAVRGASEGRQIDATFAEAASGGWQAIIISTDALFNSERARIVANAARARIPAIYYDRAFTEAGGLLSYGTSIVNAYREAGGLVARILRGASPASLPVLQPTTYQLTVNMRAAQDIGLTLPPALLARVDEFIE